MTDMEKLFNRADVIAAIEDENLDYVYKLDSTEEITQFLVDKGVDPLEYVTEVWAYMFFGFDINSITIPGRIKTIHNRAFESCTDLETVTIEEGVKRIKTQAFAGCKHLTVVNLPSTIEGIGEWAFHSKGLVVNYNGTVDDFDKIVMGSEAFASGTRIHCLKDNFLYLW